MGTDPWQCLGGPKGGSGGCISGDFPISMELDCPEPMFPGPNGARKEGKAKKGTVGPRVWVAQARESLVGELGRWALDRFKTGSSWYGFWG